MRKIVVWILKVLSTLYMSRQREIILGGMADSAVNIATTHQHCKLPRPLQ